MKFTKLMALVLVLLMTVVVFVACNDQPDETTPADDTTIATPDDTTVPEETDASECTHQNSLKKTGNDKPATCLEAGYFEYKCSKCGGYAYREIEQLEHTYGSFRSVDGKYTKYLCNGCKSEYVLDETGAEVADYSAVKFPLFAGSFDNVETLDEVVLVFEGFSITPKMANIVKTDPNGEIYLNIPSGTAAYAPNGCLDLGDDTAKLVGKAFTLTFLARYEEKPLETIALLTWTVDGNAQVLLSADKNGNYIDAKGSVVAKSPDKGWDSFEVVFAADGSYTISLNDEQIATGTVVTSGSTSVIRFFDDKSQFEAYLDEIIICD